MPVSLRRLAASLLAGAAVLALAEILARLVFPVAEIAGFDRIHYSPTWSGSEDRGNSLGHASFRWTSDPDAAGSLHQLNLYGFRDREWSAAPPDSSTRVAFVGDSFVEGFMAGPDETIPAVFGDLATAAGVAVDTLNLGVGAAGLAQYSWLIRDALPVLRPDQVILIVYANDFVPTHFDPAWWLAPRARLLGSWRASRLFGVAAALQRGERVARAWTDAPFAFVPAVPDPRNPWSNADWVREVGRVVSPRIRAAMQAGRFNPFAVGSLAFLEQILSEPQDVSQHLAALHAGVTREGAELAVVYLPSQHQVSDAYFADHLEYSEPPGVTSFQADRFQAPARQLRDICGALGVPFFDLTAGMRARERAGERLFWRYDEHLRPGGYRLVAELLFDWWQQLHSDASRR